MLKVYSVRFFIHVDANDVRQSEITKNDVKEVCEFANTMSDTVICFGPLPTYHGDEIRSRLPSLNGWMSKWCPQNNRLYRQLYEFLGKT